MAADEPGCSRGRCDDNELGPEGRCAAKRVSCQVRCPRPSTIPCVTAYDDLDTFEHLDASSLPERQQRILVTIRDWVNRHGYSPSSREIGEAVGLRSSSAVSKHLASLEDKGFLRRGATMSRPIDVRVFLREPQTRESDDSVSVPVVGHIAAGTPISADEHVDDMLTLPRGLTGRGNVFGLRVRGDSMIEAAICDGDIVVVRQQSEAHSGQIVAAMIDEEATVKVYRRRNGHVYLEPRNPDYEVIDGDNAVVLGTVVSVLRSV
jgi:repressor LexA